MDAMHVGRREKLLLEYRMIRKVAEGPKGATSALIGQAASRCRRLGIELIATPLGKGRPHGMGRLLLSREIKQKVAAWSGDSDAAGRRHLATTSGRFLPPRFLCHLHDYGEAAS